MPAVRRSKKPLFKKTEIQKKKKKRGKKTTAAGKAASRNTAAPRMKGLPPIKPNEQVKTSLNPHLLTKRR